MTDFKILFLKYDIIINKPTKLIKVKKEVYEKSGVKEYLIVDPKTRTIDV
jgi:Uma2 family endonuclease